MQADNQKIPNNNKKKQTLEVATLPAQENLVLQGEFCNYTFCFVSSTLHMG